MKKIYFLVAIGVLILGGAGCASSDTPASSFRPSNKKECVEPNNPYDSDSGHYAGFEWGLSGKGCGGNSQSFIEGCEEYERQEAAYNSCQI